jgi:riboflavin kinase/FMN adenylyltransferase
VLLDAAKDIAVRSGTQLVVASFDPHPAAVLRPDSFAGLLTTPEHRTQLLLEVGADRVEMLRFDDELRAMSPEDFVEHVLVEREHAHAVVVGENFRFGHHAAGTTATLRTLGQTRGIDVYTVGLAGDAGTDSGNSWSSTRVRNALQRGDISAANEILGRPHRVTGEVVHGDHRGRELGYPTANLDVRNGVLIPADGVYAGLLWQGTTAHPVAVSIGTNPTFDGVIGRRVEAHVLGRTDLDLYGQELDLDVIAHVRPMLKFAGIDQLLAAMANDLEVSRSHIASHLRALGGDFADDTVRW